MGIRLTACVLFYEFNQNTKQSSKGQDQGGKRALLPLGGRSELAVVQKCDNTMEQEPSVRVEQELKFVGIHEHFVELLIGFESIDLVGILDLSSVLIGEVAHQGE